MRKLVLASKSKIETVAKILSEYKSGVFSKDTFTVEDKHFGGTLTAVFGKSKVTITNEDVEVVITSSMIKDTNSAKICNKIVEASGEWDSNLGVTLQAATLYYLNN